MQEPYRTDATRMRARPAPPDEPVDLGRIADDLLAGLRDAESIAVALVTASEAPLSQTLLALRGGSRLPDHEDVGAATLQGVRGKARLVTSSGAREIAEGLLVAVHGGRHHLEAADDAVVLVTFAQLPD